MKQHISKDKRRHDIVHFGVQERDNKKGERKNKYCHDFNYCPAMIKKKALN